MKLFDNFEIVRFPQENMLLVTDNGYLYYIYNYKYNYWKKHRRAGYDSITVCNYQEVSKEEIISVMNGLFPQKATDFMRMCNPSQLSYIDMFDLLMEDYPKYMSDQEINDTVHSFLLESNICHVSFLKLQKLFNDAPATSKNKEELNAEIKKLSFEIIGRDIFKEEIDIINGHDCSSYFWIKPVRVVDNKNTNDIDSVAEMKSVEISIEQDDVDQYLTPFLYKHFDGELEANKNRIDSHWYADDEDDQPSYLRYFEWYLTHNFYSFNSMTNILNDINDTIDALSSGKTSEFTEKLKEKRGTATQKLIYAKDLTEEQIKEYNANRPKEDNTKSELIIDFYRRFIYRIEYMMKIGQEAGYDLISFMGP